MTVSGDSIDIDFAGTAPQYEGNLNCPLAVTRSACFYVVRCLTAPTCRRRAAPSRPSPCARPRARSSTRARRLPSRPGTRRRRAASLTSSLDAFSKAIAVPAQGQGTMNNTVLRQRSLHVLRDDRRRSGRVPGADGPSGVHVAMSNTFNTPAEALELAYPLRVERYELRPGSGGDGLHRGGDGIVRELRILEPCRLSLLTQRRALAPRGARGGEDGQPGRNFLNGEELPAIANLDLQPGDLLRIETPGGGGWESAPRGDRP